MTRAFNAPIESSATKFVLVALADNANDQGSCFPSIQTLAEKTSLSRRGVQIQIRKLEEMGLVESCPIDGSSNVYKLHLPEEWANRPKREGGAGGAPVHGVHRGGARGARGGRTSCTGGAQEVHPNHHITIIEPPLNHQGLVLESVEPERPKPKKPPRQKQTEPEFDLLDPPEFQEQLKLFWQHRKEIGKAYKPTGWQQALAKARQMPAHQLKAAVAHSIANGYQGIFEPSGNGKAQLSPHLTRSVAGEGMDGAMTPDEYMAWSLEKFGDPNDKNTKLQDVREAI